MENIFRYHGCYQEKVGIFVKTEKLKNDAISLNSTGTKMIPIYDVIKALGIISIVIGHCHPNMDVVRFVYGYHLALFFFVAGLQFSDKKYADQPFMLLQNRIKSMWPSYFLYMTLFTLLHNLCTKMHFLPGSSTYAVNLIFEKVVKNFFLSGNEMLGGAMWFVPMMLSGTVVFSVIVYLSSHYLKRFRIIPIILLSIVAGIVGVHANLSGYSYSHYTHTALLLIPILLIGYILSLYKIRIEKVLYLPIAVVCLIIYVYLTVFKDNLVNLAAKQIVSSVLFYPITLTGIYFVCYLAKIISKNKYFQKAFAFIGKYSFDIMALHFLIFKVIDLVCGLILKDSPERYAAFPRAYSYLWPIYLLVSVVLAPLFRVLCKRIYSQIEQFFERLNKKNR